MRKWGGHISPAPHMMLLQLTKGGGSTNEKNVCTNEWVTFWDPRAWMGGWWNGPLQFACLQQLIRCFLFANVNESYLVKTGPRTHIGLRIVWNLDRAQSTRPRDDRARPRSRDRPRQCAQAFKKWSKTRLRKLLGAQYIMHGAPNFFWRSCGELARLTDSTNLELLTLNAENDIWAAPEMRSPMIPFHFTSPFSAMVREPNSPSATMYNWKSNSSSSATFSSKSMERP